MSYIAQRTNQIDCACHALNALTLILRRAGGSILRVRVLGSVAIILVWTQLFFWFRLFDSLAQYVDLIGSTVVDIGHFMLVFGAIALTFLSGFYMLNLNRMAADAPTVFRDFDEQGTSYMQGVINIYFMLLGDFHKDGFLRPNIGYLEPEFIWMENWLAILYFFGATFIGQIVIFNMLIAIMAATFDRHNEDLDANAKRQKLILQSEYEKLAKGYGRVFARCGRCCKSGRGSAAERAQSQQSSYLYVVMPQQGEDDESDGDEEHSEIKAVKRAMELKFRGLDSLLSKRLIPSLGALSDQVASRLESLEHTTADLAKNIKREQQNKFRKMKEDIQSENRELMEHINQVEAKLRAEIPKHQRPVLAAIAALDETVRRLR